MDLPLGKSFHPQNANPQWLVRICGQPGEFEIEFQVLNWVLIMNALVGVLLTIENLLLQIPAPAAEGTLGITAICLVGYYLVRIKKIFSQAIAPLIYIFFLLPVTFIWFSSDGLEGAMPYFYILPILAGVSIMHGWTRRIVLSATIIHLFALIVIEKLIPQMVSPYPSDFARWVDTLVGVVYAVCYGLGYIKILVYNLDQRRESIEQLINNILPKSIVERLKNAPGDPANKLLTKQIMDAFAKTIDYKDNYTKGHSSRVAEYTCLIADKMGCSEEQLDEFHDIALLHDIGKISIPDAVLNKTEVLSDEECLYIKQHAITGYDILSKISLFPDLALGARYHHERVDGTGYPSGLTKDEIPMVARIIAVADTFDAMSSTRPYRKQLPIDAVIEELKRVAGFQLDAEMVEIMISLVNEGKVQYDLLN